MSNELKEIKKKYEREIGLLNDQIKHYSQDQTFLQTENDRITAKVSKVQNEIRNLR